MKSDIEYAALSHDVPWHLQGGRVWLNGAWWNPLGDDGDSRRLEIACLNWLMDAPEAIFDDVMEISGVLYLLRARPLNNAEYRAAVFALAVEIGKVMEGKDNAE
jgi:hypothetical protein